jgi:hypothetical protein
MKIENVEEAIITLASNLHIAHFSASVLYYSTGSIHEEDASTLCKACQDLKFKIVRSPSPTPKIESMESFSSGNP